MTQITKRGKATVHEICGLGIADDFFVQLYDASGRSFPWRTAKTNSFGILVAEVLLKQTRAEQVAKVWPSLVSRYKNAAEMAVAAPDELFEMIALLGLGKQRVRALIDVASSITQLGEIPNQPEDLVKLPYVGIYTAHAVACFSFDQRVPVVDLSIVRVLSRIMGVKPPTDIRRAEVIWNVAWALLPQKYFKEHNYGLLDFAALVCKSRSPRCSDCPLAAKCVFAKRSSPG